MITTNTKHIDKADTISIVTKVDALTNGMTYEQLRAVYNMVLGKMKAVKNLESVSMKNTLCVGQMVEWNGRRGNRKGKVRKINRTRALVTNELTKVNWLVPMAMLKVID